MSNTIEVYVRDSDGDLVSGKHVLVSIMGIFSGGDLEGYTDDDGYISFETADDYEDSREMYVHVGDFCESYRIDDSPINVSLD